jgi:hypothetical protein
MNERIPVYVDGVTLDGKPLAPMIPMRSAESITLDANAMWWITRDRRANGAISTRECLILLVYPLYWKVRCWKKQREWDRFEAWYATHGSEVETP